MTFAQQGMALGVLVLVGCTQEAAVKSDDLGSGELPHAFHIPAEGNVEIGGMEMGRGRRPLIVLHGGPGMDHRYLRPAMDALADDRWLIYMDQRGSGLSETELTPERINFDALIADIDRVREWTGFETVDILGHSWGAVLALHYALRNPAAVDRMVLVSPTEPGTRFQAQAMERRSAKIDAADQALLTELSATPEFLRGEVSAVSRYYELVFRPLMFDPDQTLKIPLDPRTARNGFGVMRALGESMPDPDYWNQLPGITARTLIVQGSADAYPVEMAMEMASALGNGRTLVLEEAGHFPYIEASAAFFEGVRAFLQTDEGS
jgi:proline iminopeptidase